MKYFVTLFIVLVSLSGYTQQTQRIYLSGTDKDHTKTWDFYCSSGRKSGVWDKIEVPSQWELQGFGTYNYGWTQNKDSETGTYRTTFDAPKEWKNQSVMVVFEGVMTDAEVKLNGTLIGAKHQGGYYRFTYDVQPFLNYGASNIIEVKVSKVSENVSVNKAELDADFWIFGGIYRPVYLAVSPKAHITRVATDAKANGVFSMETYLNNVKAGYTVSAQIVTLNGDKVGESFFKEIRRNDGDTIALQQVIDAPKLWNAETPNLYRVEVSLLKNGEVIHRVTERFGFRTIEIRKYDGFYVNGQKILLKGINRHSSWPESGRCLSREIHLLDINLIKEMNMNAVRMSHYPPDVEFLDLCDSLGLYVFDEITGWQASYDTEAGAKLVRETVTRDANHPCILVWDNGNEGGWNRELDDDFAKYDLQKREVFHPWEKFSYWDSKHYPGFNYLVNASLYSKEIILPTEFLHGLFDGGMGAGLDDYWNLFLQHPNFAGGFLWVFADEGIVRTDENNRVDANQIYYPDGIVGPYREKEASFYTVREIWSPIFISPREITNQFDGKLKVENRYDFTNLHQCTFSWKMVQLPSSAGETTKMLEMQGDLARFDLAPWEQGTLNLNLPKERLDYDVLYLTATDWSGREIYTWSWPLKTADEQKLNLENQISTNEVQTKIEEGILTVIANGIRFNFDETSGYLTGVHSETKDYSISEGPRLAGVQQEFTGLKQWSEGKNLKLHLSYKGEGSWMNATWTFEPGKLARLDYQYGQKGEVDFMGITFNYPEEKVKGMKWLGDGPYRVWKNRLKGGTFGVWEKAYNNSITGETWDYPEFKGYHADLYWVQVQTQEGDFVIHNTKPGAFLQMLKPQQPTYTHNTNYVPAFPDGDIGIMNAIAPIGTKFQNAGELGPQSGKSKQLNYAPIKGSLYFEFE
ncbi:MAG: glycoside hydrolase family 2 TIM barrel-domain containing protein [Prolixibacteraceae bacterium]